MSKSSKIALGLIVIAAVAFVIDMRTGAFGGRLHGMISVGVGTNLKTKDGPGTVEGIKDAGEQGAVETKQP